MIGEGASAYRQVAETGAANAQSEQYVVLRLSVEEQSFLNMLPGIRRMVFPSGPDARSAVQVYSLLSGGSAFAGNARGMRMASRGPRMIETARWQD